MPRAPGAKEYFVAPNGAAGNPGTQASPWDIASALEGKHKVAPGDVIWLRGGAYKHPDRKTGFYPAKLVGTKEAPIHVRAYPGERATIDGGISVENPAAFLWIWDLEILVSDGTRETVKTATDTTELNRPWGGLEARGGQNCKFINLVIHDCCQGMGVWSSSKDTEVHGCVIYDNGWQGSDRHHGHCIYTQNQDGAKTILGCILKARRARTGGSYTMHAYGSGRAYVDNYVIEDNIAYQDGTFLIGGGRPSQNVKVCRNYLFGIGMQIGYTKGNEDCEVRDNVVAKGGINIQDFKKVVNEGNIKELPAQKAVLIPNKYDPNRAHVAIFNGAKAAAVAVAAAPFLKPGDKFRAMKPEDVFGQPVFEGTCSGPQVSLPVQGEFAAYVLLKQ